MNNPLLQKFDTPFNTIPFEEIKLEHYQPAMEKAMELGKADIEAIKNNSFSPNFNNTIEALERSGKQLDVISSIFFNLNSCETSDEMQQIAQTLSPMLSAYSDDILLDVHLFKKIKTAYETTDKQKLSTEEVMLLEKTYKSFVRNGANLDDESKKILKEFNTRLSILSLTFGENLLKDSNQFELWIENEDDLVGLPDGVREAARMSAKEKGLSAEASAKAGKKIFMAFGSRSFNDNEYNNEKIVKEIAALRHKKAVLLGYASHADIVLEERMAEKPEKVYNLLNELLEHAKPVAIKELQEVQDLCNKLKGPNPMERWDFSYYSEKLK